MDTKDPHSPPISDTFFVLRRAKRRKTNFTDANLTFTDLRKAEFAGTSQHRADLTGIDLHGAHLDGADLFEAKFFDARLSDEQLQASSPTPRRLARHSNAAASLLELTIRGAIDSQLARRVKPARLG